MPVWWLFQGICGLKSYFFAKKHFCVNQNLGTIWVCEHVPAVTVACIYREVDSRPPHSSIRKLSVESFFSFVNLGRIVLFCTMPQKLFLNRLLRVFITELLNCLLVYPPQAQILDEFDAYDLSVRDGEIEISLDHHVVSVVLIGD